MSSTQQRRPEETAGGLPENVTAAQIPFHLPYPTAQVTPTGETASMTPPVTEASRVDINTTPATENVDTAPPAGMTIGGALEVAGERKADKPLAESDARAIQSAEAKATGVPGGLKGGPAAKAQSVIDKSQNVTVGEVLTDATAALARDKIVTPEDASAVQSAEARHIPGGGIASGGVASTMLEAADVNVDAGLVSADQSRAGA
ncbi:hypothetical protein R1sor_018650 [Riccia sorocarpa]|uniref:SMP domain-containing protein n=1 Tax=Riccia sorocarpa TaxID=122646 RepID=A0ABD3IA99_9MARC